jgi:filamentous hemagglutinin family protein
MNHIYRTVWSESLGTWIAVSEKTKNKSKRSSKNHKLLATGLLLCSSTSWALPTGEQVVAGQVNVATPHAGQMQINQGSQKAIVNWQGFSLNPNEIVNIQQPNANATLLNRVIGMDASIIQGQINANGQVFLVNPNGVLFSKTAQVDVGGLVASTHTINNGDFLNGHLHFISQDNAGTVSNQGYIRVPEGGIVALIGSQVSNAGTIATPKGTSVLAAGKTVDLDFKGDGLVEVKVPEAALNAQVENKGAILADGGRVVLTAQAAGQLTNTVLNSEGLLQAKGLIERNGEIILDGGNSGVTQA